MALKQKSLQARCLNVKRPQKLDDDKSIRLYKLEDFKQEAKGQYNLEDCEYNKTYV